jgi:hypothetical protein
MTLSSSYKEIFAANPTSGDDKSTTHKHLPGTPRLSRVFVCADEKTIQYTGLDDLSPQEDSHPSLHMEWWQEYFEEKSGMEFEFEGGLWKVYKVFGADGSVYIAYYDADRKCAPTSMDDPGVGDFLLTPNIARGTFGVTIGGEEFIRPGDTIKYCDPIYTAGDARGRRETTVMEVRGTHPLLVLADGAVLGEDHQVCRVKRFHRRR